MSDLTLEVKDLARAQGAHLVGIAPVDRFEGAPKGHHPTDLLRGAKSVVVIAHRFFQGVLECDRFGRKSELIPDEELWEVQQTVFRFMYDTANMRLQQIGEDDGEALLSGLLEKSDAPSLAHFVRSLVGMDRDAAHAAFSGFLNDRSLTSSQIRFIEMIVDQLTSRGVMDSSALYEAPFSNLHSGGPNELFVGKENVIAGIFDTLKAIQPVPSQAG